MSEHSGSSKKKYEPVPTPSGHDWHIAVRIDHFRPVSLEWWEIDDCIRVRIANNDYSLMPAEEFRRQIDHLFAEREKVKGERGDE